MNRAIISIIIPTPHQSKLIQQTLNSLRAQTFQEWEALVVDDGSHDEIPEKMLSMSRENGRIKYIKRTRQNSGAPACRNEGTYFSQGKYLIYLDSDDFWHRGHFSIGLSKWSNAPSLISEFFPAYSFASNQAI
ncbi:MAG: hypothetical protein BRC50_03930 [Cyanobacteria bacterium SW_11_48_12]|nr:MAG: hypothetical protein BRC50_03930 [Cyanobacteria bacterium SW_11_48_12]